MGQVNTTKITKMVDEANKKARDLDKVKLLAKCECTHTKASKGSDGTRDYTLMKDGNDNKVKCYQCGAQIDLSASSLELLEHDVNSIVNILDVAKAQIAMGGNENDMHLIEKIAKFQFDARTVITDTYRAITKKNKQNKARRHSDNGGNNGGSTTWGAGRR